MRCKLCDLLPDAQLEKLIAEDKPSRYIASLYNIGKTTVQKHKKDNHSSKVVPSRETEGKSVTWNGNSGVFETGALEQELSDRTPEDIIAMFGHDPNQVAIKGVIRESHKQYWSRDLNEMLWKHTYSFAVERKTGYSEGAEIDPVEILNSLTQTRSTGATGPKNKGLPTTFVLDWADWQYAKKEGGGTEGLIRRVESAFASAVERVQELRTIGRNLEELVIIGGGDMVEGCVIYPNQSYEIDGNRREQIRGTVALILRGITMLAPYFDKVRVVVVPGNHGEHRILGNRTTIGDNDDLLVFEMAEVACSTNPKLSHVEFEIAEREISVTTEIMGWTYGITHGDVYGKSGGNGVRNKVFNWFKTMAANRHPVGSADVLVTHHFHHDASEDWGLTLWVQNPTLDGGSHYYREATGHDTKPGMNSWVVSHQERFMDKQILR
nr:MAG TPA: DNA polymerase II small subunit [Caudoviricetes sp.]